MASIFDISPVLWRSRLREASFKGAPFHVEQQGRMSGRRTVLHEYPKRDQPYAEDLGRHAIRYQITGYVIQKFHVAQGSSMSINYDECRDRLCSVLEDWGPGPLVDPYNNRIREGGTLICQCERYTMTESRERGGYAQFDMMFVEAGIPAFSVAAIDTISVINRAANEALSAAADQLNRQQSVANDPAAGAGSTISI